MQKKKVYCIESERKSDIAKKKNGEELEAGATCKNVRNMVTHMHYDNI